MTPFELIIGGIAFFMGIVSVPIFGFVVAPSLPGAITEPIANILITVMCLGMEDPTLHQREDDTYEYRPGEGVDGAPRKWTRWAMSRFGFTYQSSPEAWGYLHADPDLRDLETLEVDVDAPFSVAQSTIQRGGIGSYVNNGADGERIRLGAALTQLKGTGLLDMAGETLSEGLKDYGGDTSAPGMKLNAAMMLTFACVGLGMGYVVFL